MERVKELLIYFRNAVAFGYSWLVICVLVVALLTGQDVMSVDFLLKLLVLCLWAAFCFVLCFRGRRITQRGFIFSLSCFYILFVPVEVALFYMTGLFKGTGSIGVWIVFGAIVVSTYITSLLIDMIVMRKKAVSYTQKLEEYINGNHLANQTDRPG